MLADPDRYRLLPDRISKEPIAPVLRFGDDAWLAVINWVFWATIQAEEFGLTRRNVAAALNSDNPTIRRFLGLEPGIADAFGLDARWPYRVIEAVGNYGEIFERHVGPNTALGLPRGPNRLWTNGGLLYAPPFR
jgi:general L-amino acid transport system substrate-binding protein